MDPAIVGGNRKVRMQHLINMVEERILVVNVASAALQLVYNPPAPLTAAGRVPVHGPGQESGAAHS